MHDQLGPKGWFQIFGQVHTDGRTDRRKVVHMSLPCNFHRWAQKSSMGAKICKDINFAIIRSGSQSRLVKDTRLLDTTHLCEEEATYPQHLYARLILDFTS